VVSLQVLELGQFLSCAFIAKYSPGCRGVLDFFKLSLRRLQLRRNGRIEAYSLDIRLFNWLLELILFKLIKFQ
jgi:hypothetical protein